MNLLQRNSFRCLLLMLAILTLAGCSSDTPAVDNNGVKPQQTKRNRAISK